MLTHTPARLVIDPAHYDGPSTERVMAPPPLGRMGARMLELAPVAHRAIDFYATSGSFPLAKANGTFAAFALAEVAR